MKQHITSPGVCKNCLLIFTDEVQNKYTPPK